VAVPLFLFLFIFLCFPLRKIKTREQIKRKR
jgi:hypothetical protein